jgi:transcriptional regulator with XRE-family HTH domain
MGINEEKYKEARRMLLEYLRKVARDKNITHKEISDKTGFTPNNVSRMLMGRYPPTLDNFLRLAESCDVYFFLIDKDSDDDLVNIMRERWGKPGSN